MYQRLSWLVAIAACTTASASVGSGSGSDNPSQRFEHDMLVRFHMHENFDVVRAIERLLIRGKLGAARDLARGIAESPDEPGMAAWATQTARVRDRATEITAAKTLDDALRGVAHLGAECAACHVASGALPDVAPALKAPPDETSVVSRMARHRWATDRMWEGMIGASETSWSAGLDILAAAPLPASELGREREALARTLQRTADRAKHVKVNARADVYGELLITCAACHMQAN